MKEKKEKEDVEQATTHVGRIFARKTFQYRQAKMACQNLLFPYLHLQKNYTTASFKFQILFPKDAWSRGENDGEREFSKSVVWLSAAVGWSRVGGTWWWGKGMGRRMERIWTGGGAGGGRRYPGLGNFCVFICLLPLRTSTVGFAEDRLASLML